MSNQLTLAANNQQQQQQPHIPQQTNQNNNNNQKTVAMAPSATKPHLCPQCQKAFSSTHQLAQHSRVHSGEKPYACAYCERKFKQLSHLQQHTRLHTGERPYKCDCGRSFIQLSNLQQHMKTHTSVDYSNNKDSDKNFFCVHCGKGFKGQSSLYIHQQRKHSEIVNSVGTVETSQQNSLNESLEQIFAPAENRKQNNNNNQQQESSSVSKLSTSMTIWSCQNCAVLFANKIGLLSHIEQMKFDPKHQDTNQDTNLPDTKNIKNELNEKCVETCINLNDILINTLFQQQSSTNGQQNLTNGNDQIISANKIAQNILNINTTNQQQPSNNQRLVLINNSIPTPQQQTSPCSNNKNQPKQQLNSRTTTNDNSTSNNFGNGDSTNSSNDNDTDSYKFYPSMS